MTRTEAVEATIQRGQREVNSVIDEEIPVRPPERLYEAARYLLDAGGKRLRPTIVLLAADALAGVEPGSHPYRRFPAADGTDIDILSAAVSIEIIQSFTLIHDDIMDDDDMRRGVPAVHREFDIETAILAGDTLYSTAFEKMLATGAPPERSVEALSALARTCTEICEGQSFDVEFEHRSDITTAEYLEMVELKTAVLFAAAASLPATLLGYDEAVDPLYAYGIDVGCAFQIRDDLLDLTTPTETLGKQRGSDLVEGKRTLVSVHARNQGVDIERLVESDTVEDLSETEVDAAVERLEAAGSLDHARTKARSLAESGKEQLSVLPDTEAKLLLQDLADYLVEREY